MGWGHQYILVRYKKDQDEACDTTYISVKDFYEESEQQISHLTELLPFPAIISSVIIEYMVPVQYNSIYILKEVEWRSDIMRTVTGLSKCFMYPDYTFIMLLTLKASLLKGKCIYYTLIKGKWVLRTDQENFTDWTDPIQDYIDALGPWRPGDDPPESVKSAEHVGGFVAYQFNKTPENEHPKAQRQYMMNQEKSHYEKVDCDHVCFEIEEIKTIEETKSIEWEEAFKKLEKDEDKLAFDKQNVAKTFDKLRKLEWKEAKTRSGKNKIIDWNCVNLDLVNKHGSIEGKCGGGCFGPRNPNWCENPIYSVRRKLWRKCILGEELSKSYWETDEDVNDPHEIIIDDHMIDVD